MRQLDYQEKKAAAFRGFDDELRRSVFLRSQLIRKKLEAVRPIGAGDKILEVGSGAHGLIFGFAANKAVGIDPLAVDYKRLFPALQQNALTVAALGEKLPFDDAVFDVVLCDNVIDHAERPLLIIDEIARVLRPGGLLYFTVNIHHPLYDIVSRAHGFWNAVGLKLEIPAFADHTVHFTERQIRDVFSRPGLRCIDVSTSVAETRQRDRFLSNTSPDSLLKKIFFKNALFEITAVRE
jgi:SAM-dependent methyltransferase